MAETKNTQLAIIGAGPGGYAAAFLAADMGIEVTLICVEAAPGGVCLYKGCIPSKALLHAAKILSEAKEAKDFGIEFPPPKIDIDKLRAWKDGIVTKLTGGLSQLVKQRKITFIQGKASFVDSNLLAIKKEDGSKENLKFKDCIIATGSRPSTLKGLGIDSPRILDSTAALELKDVPKSLLIVGGGYIGLELGCVYRELGSKITVVEMTNGLLPGADRDIVRILSKKLEDRFEAIMLNTKVTDIKDEKDSVKVKFENDKAGGKEHTFDKVLIAVGRKPDASDLGLENTKVQIDKNGFIKVDLKRKTDDTNIYAIGDIAGEPMLAHKASHEARVAVEAIAGKNVVFKPRTIPAVVFTDPEIAWCGLTESQAAEENRPIKVAKFPWGASGRAATLNRKDGLTKLIIDPETERLLGVCIVGVGAGELIAEGVLAVQMGALASDIKLSIHAHPTLSETIMESAEVFFGQSTHLYKPKRDAGR